MKLLDLVNEQQEIVAKANQAKREAEKAKADDYRNFVDTVVGAIDTDIRTELKQLCDNTDYRFYCDRLKHTYTISNNLDVPLARIILHFDSMKLIVIGLFEYNKLNFIKSETSIACENYERFKEEENRLYKWLAKTICK